MPQPGVYILQSVKNGRYYVGSTSKLEERINYHNAGRVRATKNMRPLTISVFIPCETITEARRFEYKLKNYKRKDVLKKVIADKLFPWQFKK